LPSCWQSSNVASNELLYLRVGWARPDDVWHRSTEDGRTRSIGSTGQRKAGIQAGTARNGEAPKSQIIILGCFDEQHLHPAFDLVFNRELT
jgi:hypothetical protein